MKSIGWTSAPTVGTYLQKKKRGEKERGVRETRGERKKKIDDDFE
jgi:hypothetical protein